MTGTVAPPGLPDSVLSTAMMRLPADVAANVSLACRRFHALAQLRLAVTHLDARLEPEGCWIPSRLTSLSVRGASRWGQAAALRHLTCVTRELPNLQSLKLHLPYFGEDQVELLLKCLASLTGLTALHLTAVTMYGGGAGEALARALRGMTGLRDLSLAGNQLTASGLKEIAGAVTRISRLTALDISGNNLRYKDFPDAAPVLNKLCSSLPHLQAITLGPGNERTSARGHGLLCYRGLPTTLAALQQLPPGLLALRMPENRLDMKGTQALVQLLKAQTALRVLDVGKVCRSFGELGFSVVLAVALARLTALTALSLKCHTLTNAAANRPLLSALQKMKQLQDLNLAGTDFTAETLPGLSCAISFCTALTRLALSVDPECSESDVCPSAWPALLLPLVCLRSLSLHCPTGVPWYAFTHLRRLTALDVTLAPDEVVLLPEESAAGYLPELKAATLFYPPDCDRDADEHICALHAGLSGLAAPGGPGPGLTQLRLPRFGYGVSLFDCEPDGGVSGLLFGSEQRPLLATFTALRHLQLELSGGSGWDDRQAGLVRAMSTLTALTALELDGPGTEDSGMLDVRTEVAGALRGTLGALRELRALRMSVLPSGEAAWLAMSEGLSQLTNLTFLYLLAVDEGRGKKRSVGRSPMDLGGFGPMHGFSEFPGMLDFPGFPGMDGFGGPGGASGGSDDGSGGEADEAPVAAGSKPSSAAAAMGKALQQMQYLQVLIAPECTHYLSGLCSALPSLNELTVLDIRKTEFSTAAVQRNLGNGLKAVPQLAALVIEDCTLASGSSKALRAGIRGISGLTRLNMVGLKPEAVICRERFEKWIFGVRRLRFDFDDSDEEVDMLE